MQETALWIPRGAFCPLEGGAQTHWHRHIGTSLTVGNEEKFPNLTEKVLFVKYDLNQLRTVPWMPTKYSSRDKRVP